MVLGALVGGVAAYAFHAWGGRQLGPDAFAPIGVMWTLAFITVAVLYLPLEQWVTREVTGGRNPLAARGLLPAVIGVAMVAVSVGTGWTLPSLTDQTPIHVAQMLVLILGYGCFWTGKGVLQGRGRYARVGLMLCAEGLVRLVVEGVVLWGGGGAVEVGWAMAVAPWVVWGFVFGGTRRLESAESGGGVFVRRYVLGSVAAHLLVAGGPLAVAYLGGTASEVSLVFVVFVLFRAPLTLMYRLQGRLLPPLVRMAGRGEEEPLRRLARRLWLGSIGLAVPAGGLGYLAGPWLVKLLMGPQFLSPGMMAGLVASGTVMAAGVQLVAQTLVAGARTGSLAAAWMAGLVVAGGVAWLSGLEPVMSVALGFWVGEATALVVVGRLAISASRLRPGVVRSQSDGDQDADRD